MKLALQTAASMVIGLVFFGVVLFLPAWTFHYWQAWVFIAVFSAATVIPSIYLAVTNPAALQRRLHAGPTAETRPTQKFVMVGTTLSVVAVMVISALDHRFGWSDVPTPLVVVGQRPGRRRPRARPVRRHPERLRRRHHHGRGRSAAGLDGPLRHGPPSPCTSAR